MTRHSASSLPERSRLLLPLVAAGLLVMLPLVAGALATAAQEATPSASPAAAELVLPVDAPAYGASYAEWGARQQQWLQSFPIAVSPASDTTGERCGYGQSGPVFFLATLEVATVSQVRDCSIPAGVALFVPLFSVHCSTVEAPPYVDARMHVVGRDETELRAACQAVLDEVPLTLEAALDGQAIPNLERYRMQSAVFPLIFPAANYYEVPAGPALTVADGYWLLLAPLAPGAHELTTSISAPDIGISAEYTYRLMVVPTGAEAFPSPAEATPAT